MLTTLVIAPALIIASVAAGDTAIDDFDGRVETWLPEMQYGDVADCKASRGDGVDGSGALRVDYDMRGGETNHIIFARQVDVDLGSAQGLSFQIKGIGEAISIFLFVYDSDGRFNNYGPHGTNQDFTSSYADWHTLRMSFERDRSVQGGNADLATVKRIGFMLWHMGPAKGTVWFENLTAIEAGASMSVTPPEFSPNGDGVYDALTVTLRTPRDRMLTIQVLDGDGKVAATLARDLVAQRRRTQLTWDGRQDGKLLPDGEYTVKATVTGAETAVLAHKASLTTKHKWLPLRYEVEPFFPIGVWFEGAPSLSGCPPDPDGARRYYDQCFADMGAHGLNCAAVPNCPEDLWETLLHSAQEHGIKIVLEVGPLVGLVSQKEPARESDVYSAAKRMYDKIGNCDSLLRYQIRDEPPPEAVPNWLLVQRILAAVDPKRPAFSCFCHAESLAQVTAQVRLPEAVVDIYPHWANTPPQTLGIFLPAFDTFKASAKGNTLWTVLQAFALPPPSWRYPTPEELRAVTYLSLAGGAKGVFYFIYQYMPDYLWGMVDKDGNARPIYATASQLAKELGKLAPLILTLQPVEMTGETPAPPLPSRRSDVLPDTPGGDVRIGRFEDPDNRPVFIIASTRPDSEVTARADGVRAGVWKDALSGEEFEVRDDVLIVPLAAGAGRVLVRQ